MLANATILLVRHGEKDDPCADDAGGKDPNLNKLGRERARKYAGYFQSYVARETRGRGRAPITLTQLFAAANSHASHRPFETLAPLALATKLPFDYTSYKDSDWDSLAGHLRSSAYDNAAVLVCWHHGKIVDLANALLGDCKPPPPPESCWPPPKGEWNCKAFGWVMQIRYDQNGVAETDWVRVIGEGDLMPDDFPPPPTPKWPVKPAL